LPIFKKEYPVNAWDGLLKDRKGSQKVIEQLKPKVVIPMHYWHHYGVLERFVDGAYKVHPLSTNSVAVSKDTLPSEPEILILKVVREGTCRVGIPVQTGGE